MGISPLVFISKGFLEQNVTENPPNDYYKAMRFARHVLQSSGEITPGFYWKAARTIMGCA